MDRTEWIWMGKGRYGQERADIRREGWIWTGKGVDRRVQTEGWVLDRERRVWTGKGVEGLVRTEKNGYRQERTGMDREEQVFIAKDGDEKGKKAGA